MRARVLLEEADALIDVLRVPVDGRHLLGEGRQENSGPPTYTRTEPLR